VGTSSTATSGKRRGNPLGAVYPVRTFPYVVDPPVVQDANFIDDKPYRARTDAQILALQALALTPWLELQVTESIVLPAGVAEIAVLFDTFDGPIIIGTNPDTVIGCKLSAYDVGRVTSVLLSATFVDANGFEWEDPDQPGEFLPEYLLTQPRNLAWRLWTSVRTSVTAWYIE
jgi:hypothetical protein